MTRVMTARVRTDRFPGLPGGEDDEDGDDEVVAGQVGMVEPEAGPVPVAADASRHPDLASGHGRMRTTAQTIALRHQTRRRDRRRSGVVQRLMIAAHQARRNASCTTAPPPRPGAVPSSAATKPATASTPSGTA